MNENRVKLLLFCGLGIILLIVVLLFIRGCNKSRNENSTPIIANVSTSVRDNTTTGDITNAVVNSIIGGREQQENTEQMNYAEILAERQMQEEAERVQQALREQAVTEIQAQEIQTAEIHRPENLTTEIQAVKIHTPENLDPELQEEADSIELPIENKKKNRFFSGKTNQIELPYFEVFGEQKVKSGSLLKLIAPYEINVDNITIPRGTVVYASVSINERAYISINNVKIKGRLYSMNKNLIDADGGTGINIGAEKKDETIQKGDEVISSLPVGGNVISETARAVSTSVRVLFGSTDSDTELIIQSNYKLYLN